MNFDQNDVDNAVLTIWKESRGDGFEGMRAVGHVIFNRVGAPDFPKTLHDVIFQKQAFTSMTVPRDPQYGLLPHPEDQQYEGAKQIVDCIIGGTDPDLTLSAMYYANLDTMDKNGWFAHQILGKPTEHPQTVAIGKQTFFK